MKRFVAVFSFSLIYPISVVHAYEVGTHEEMSQNAVEISQLAKGDILTDLGLKSLDENQKFPNSKNNSGRIIELFRNGANFEDDNVRPLNHFFDPKSGYGLAIPNARPSPDWALEDKGDVTDVSGRAQDFSYKDARKYFLDALTETTEDERNKNFGKTFQTLGMVIHHIQDMAQPQHVRNDDHCDDDRCKLVFRHFPSLYEKFTDNDKVRPTLPYTGYTPVYSPSETLAFNTPRKF
jgi:hypothetical protein